MRDVTRRMLRRLLEQAACGVVMVSAVSCDATPTPAPRLPPTSPSPSLGPPAPLQPPPPSTPVLETLSFGCDGGAWDPSSAYPDGHVFLGHGAVLAQQCARKAVSGPICESRYLKNRGDAGRYPKVLVVEDTVERFDHPELMIGPIDTPTKAALRLSFEIGPIDCALTTVRDGSNGYLVRLKKDMSNVECGGPDVWLTYQVSRDGVLSVVSREPIPGIDRGCSGRRPPGYEAPIAVSSAPAGAWLASNAQLEAASVFAFAHLALELRALHAPSRLIEQAQAFAHDEVRHAVLTDRLAAAYGGRREAVQARPPAMRSLLAIATDNLVEGCIRETFGALLAMVQAARATDEHVARGMEEIADEELSHAAFSWELAAWAAQRLSPAERCAITAFAENALTQFNPAADAPRADDTAALGWPPPSEMARLRRVHASTVRALWA